MGNTQVSRMTDAEFRQLLTGLKAGSKAAMLSVDRSLTDGVSYDDASRAEGDWYVVWGERDVPHWQNGTFHLGRFTNLHIINRERAAELIRAGGWQSGGWRSAGVDNPGV